MRIKLENLLATLMLGFGKNFFEFLRLIDVRPIHGDDNRSRRRISAQAVRNEILDHRIILRELFDASEILGDFAFGQLRAAFQFRRQPGKPVRAFDLALAHSNAQVY